MWNKYYWIKSFLAPEAHELNKKEYENHQLPDGSVDEQSVRKIHIEDDFTARAWKIDVQE